MGITIGGIVGAVLAGWFGGRAHLRSNQLRGLDKVLGMPAGSLESRANDATESAADALGQAAAAAIDRRTGGSNGDGK